MKNALIGVKKVADKVTKYSNIENGVVSFLKEYLIKKD